MPNLDMLADQATKSLGKFFEASDPTTLQIAIARIAASTLSSWTRHKQTEGAREATIFMMAGELAEDKTQLKKYLKAAMPSAPVLKALKA